MKKINIFRSLLAVLAIPAAGLFTSCENAESPAIDNRVYIHEAASGQAAKVAVEEDGAKLSLTVRMAEALSEDVTVKLTVDPTILESYNAINKTNFESLPNEYYAFVSQECVIPAGQVSAAPSVINVQTFTTGGKNYALPVIIEQVNGPVEKTITSSKFIFLLDKPLIVPVPIMSGGTNNAVVQAGPFDEANKPINWGVQTLTWTLEGWVRMDGHKKNNQALFNTGSGDHEIYIRFGDVDRPFDYLQIKTLGGQVQTGHIFKANLWYHFALTYDGSTCNIYINGEKEASFAPPAPKGGTVRFDYMQMISSSSTYFQNKCNLSQVRLWKVALTQTQIQNNRFYELDATNPDMMAYWKMDEGSGTTFRDATGNNRDAVAQGAILKGWTEPLRFDK